MSYYFVLGCDSFAMNVFLISSIYQLMLFYLEWQVGVHAKHPVGGLRERSSFLD